jgi:superfamily II DNA or RNA helicase
LKRERPLRLFREVLPQEGESIYPRRFDLLILDEAHNCAPSGRSKYATDSLRTEAVRLLAPHFEHKLFLTATPHNGYPESFTALLELLGDFSCLVSIASLLTPRTSFWKPMGGPPGVASFGGALPFNNLDA